MSEQQKLKLPKGYYLISIIFIVITLWSLSQVDGDTRYLINLGFYSTYVSSLGIGLCKVYIYNLSIYGLMKNRLWGLILTTIVSLNISVVSLRDLIEYLNRGQYRYGIITFIFLFVFSYLISIIIRKISKCLEN